jgi:hypothetical protein
MGKSLAERQRQQAEIDHAVLRVGGLLMETAREEGEGPILHMITKSWNRTSGTCAVQILIVIAESGTLVDISTEVATILELRYSPTHRGVVVQAVGTNVHHHLTYSLACHLYGVKGALDRLAYRSV